MVTKLQLNVRYLIVTIVILLGPCVLFLMNNSNQGNSHKHTTSVFSETEAETETGTETVGVGLARNPHIIWFVVDDLGYSDYSLHNSEYQTPNIDSLAEHGIQLEQHYTSPLCSPSRAAFLTGRHPYSMGLFGLDDMIHPTGICHIPARFQTLPVLLKSIGYSTYAYGKWHLGYSKDSYTPLGRGFDHHIGYYQYSINKFTKKNLHPYAENGYDWFVDGEVSHTGNDQYSTDLILQQIKADVAGRAVEAKADPYFMYIAFQNPHFPLGTPEEMYEGYDNDCERVTTNSRRVRYCRDVLYLDYSIGTTITALKDAGMYDDSLILMTVDNGPYVFGACTSLYSYTTAGSAWPYRAGKYTYFQGGVLTTAIVTGGENVIPQRYHGRKNYHVWHASDWYQTILHFTDFSENGDLSLLSDDFDDKIRTGYDMFDILFDKRFSVSQSSSSITDSTFYMTNREYLVLSVSADKTMSVILWNDGRKLLRGVTLETRCDVRSPRPGSDVWEGYTDINSDTCQDLCLFDLKQDPTENNDLLTSGTGSDTNYTIVNASYAVFESIASWLSTCNVKQPIDVDVPTEWSKQDGYEGSRVPFQDDDEPEWPLTYMLGRNY